MLAESVKPTYEELVQRVQQLEAELVELRNAEASYKREKSLLCLPTLWLFLCDIPER